VMAAINALGSDLTVIMIAHRLSTLAGCDLIYRLDGGRIVAQGGYHAIITDGMEAS
jgi:ABC-type multidrug transport system fused ATPase/permease subunit